MVNVLGTRVIPLSSRRSMLEKDGILGTLLSEVYSNRRRPVFEQRDRVVKAHIHQVPSVPTPDELLPWSRGRR